MTADLIVTIDTEEEGLWSGRFSADEYPVHNIRGIPVFQRLCDDLGIAPTYLINSPIIEDDYARQTLGDILHSQRCEIGTHIHPWNTPPRAGEYSAHDSYLCNLPLHVQRAKLRVVTEQIRQGFDINPTSFRAGRYGLDRRGAQILFELGYQVDSSVCPYTDYSCDGGPDFRGAPCHPYWVGEQLIQPAATGDILEVPVSFGFNRTNFDLAFRIHERLTQPRWRRLRLNGICDRLGLLQKIKFSPEKGDAPRLLRLARAYAENRLPCLVMMFHSSSLVPGNTPYVTTEQALARFLAVIREVLGTCVAELGMRPATLSEFAANFRTKSQGAI